MPAKGRRNVPNIGFVDTVPAGSALQAVLITQDAQIDEMSSLVSDLQTLASALTAAAAIADVNAAGTALTASLTALSVPSKALLK